MAKTRKCLSCGKTSSMYISYSKLYRDVGVLPICKECIKSEYLYLLGKFDRDVEKAIYYLCMKIDMPYHANAFEGSKKQCKEDIENIWYIYIQKINSLRSSNDYADDFLSGERISLDGEIANINLDDYESIEVAMLAAKWGDGIPVDDLKYLEEKFYEWDASFEISGKNRVLIVDQICFEELEIKRDRANRKDVTKRLKTITELMKLGDLSPKQETAAESAEFASFPEFINQVEKTKPAYIENHELKDVDNLKGKIEAMAGAINRTKGVSDKSTDTFDEEFQDYTLDLSNLEDKK